MLTQTVHNTLSQLIDGHSNSIAVAFSGGGDSAALLSFVCKWAKTHNKNVFALIVDHGLRDASVGECIAAAKTAAEMGAQAHILNWDGPKPTSALQEKARYARYALLGHACRELGCTQLLLGHTQDDQAETLFMRVKMQSGWRGYAGMRMRAQSPIWPALYDIEVLRPLLGITRVELREYNAQNEVPYIDDPSNENHKFARVRVRAQLAKLPEIKTQFTLTAKHAQACLAEEKEKIRAVLAEYLTSYPWGGVTLDIVGLTAHSSLAPEVLKYLIRAVSGNAQPVLVEKIERLATGVCRETFRGATLGGAQFVKWQDNQLLIVRDPGDIFGRHQKKPYEDILVSSQKPILWDGRLLFHVKGEGLRLSPVMAHYESLSATQKQILKTVPEPARAGLACVLQGDEVIWSYGQIAGDLVQMSCYVEAHLTTMVT
ncbi:MAG: tRNA lysidine(34) synthetase TilS [Robiginitomaculum sp.]|nr:MAG: tRNA lysidine(34) synthetase TilS [Robiginitomaculum sp.]